MGQNSGQDRNSAFKVIASEHVTIITAGTNVHPTSNTDAVFVRVINNTSALVMVGMQDAEVDATTTPVYGFPLAQYSSRVFAVEDDASEVSIDADTNGTIVSIEILERN